MKSLHSADVMPKAAMHVPTEALVRRIDELLPQTQCQRCGYAGCKPYAEAIVNGEADINQCPPGGSRGIYRLATLLEREFMPLSPAHGAEGPRHVVAIDEAACIGCTLCIQACPVDAIVGATKLMHTVISAQCTGCDLCMPPCPVDCISLVAAPSGGGQDDDPAMSAEERALADAARARYQFRQFRLAREESERAERLSALKSSATDPRQALVAAAIERARRARA